MDRIFRVSDDNEVNKEKIKEICKILNLLVSDKLVEEFSFVDSVFLEEKSN